MLFLLSFVHIFLWSLICGVISTGFFITFFGTFEPRFKNFALPQLITKNTPAAFAFCFPPHQECVGWLMSCDHHHVAVVHTISPSLAFCTFHIRVDRMGMVQRQFEYRCLASTWIYATATTSLFYTHRHTHKHIRECDVLQCTVFDDDRQLVWSWAFHLCFYSHHTFTSETQICIVEEFIMPIKIVAEHFLALFWAGKMCFNVVHNVANSEGMSRNVWNKIELCWTPPLDIPAPLVIPWRQSKLVICILWGTVEMLEE